MPLQPESIIKTNMARVQIGLNRVEMQRKIFGVTHVAYMSLSRDYLFVHKSKHEENLSVIAAGRHLTHHWSDLYGPLRPSLSVSTERTQRISLPTFGKN